MPSMVPAANPPVSCRRPISGLTALLVTVHLSRCKKLGAAAIGAIDVAIAGTEQATSTRPRGRGGRATDRSPHACCA